MKLNTNVHFVIGKSGNSCIYDLREAYLNLYHLNQEATMYVNSLLCGELADTSNAEQLICKKILVDDSVYCESSSINKIDDDFSFAWIEITKACPYKCIHCYNESDKNIHKYFMSVNDFKLACNQLHSVGIRKIQIIGGEPTIHPELEAIIRIAVSRFDKVEIFTNGYNINDSLIDICRSNNVELALSYYSDIEEQYEKVTQIKGSFKKVTSAIQKLNANRIKYRLECIAMNNISYTPSLLSLIRREPDTPRLVGTATLDLYNQSLLNQKKITPKDFKKKIKSSKIRLNMTSHQCFSKKLYIDQELNCYPCVMERELIHGNIKDNELSSIIDKTICHFNKDHIKVCRDCEYRYACFDCRPDRMCQSYDSKPWYCTYDPINGKWSNEIVF